MDVIPLCVHLPTNKRQINVCNAWREGEGERERERERDKLFDIWFMFRIWEFVVNYDYFICLTCILYVVL